MYFVAVFLFSWGWFYLRADKSRVRELFGVAVYTAFLGLLTDLIMVHYKLWSYSGLPHPLYVIPLTLDFGIYPVVSYLFTQRLPQRWGRICVRVFLWTMPSVLFEYVTLRTHHMRHHMWWSLWLSFAADLVIYSSIALLYRYYRPFYAPQRM